MSLDVYLTRKGRERGPSELRERIFIRQAGSKVEVTRAEWDELYPGSEPVVFLDGDDDGQVFTANITHNLGKMATEAGLYDALWRPDEHGLERAEQLIEPLARGLTILRDDRPRFEAFNPANGWGDYDGLVRFTTDYLEACVRWPDAEVRVWR